MSTFSFDFQCKKKRECMDYHWKKVGFERLTYGNVEKIITTVSQITDFISQILVIKVSFGTWTWMISCVKFAILLESHWNQFKKDGAYQNLCHAVDNLSNFFSWFSFQDLLVVRKYTRRFRCTTKHSYFQQNLIFKYNFVYG
jgi:hypothetical protein